MLPALQLYIPIIPLIIVGVLIYKFFRDENRK